MDFFKAAMNLRLRRSPGLNQDTLGEINEDATCYAIGEQREADGLNWAHIVAPVTSGAWLEGWAATAYEGDTLLAGYVPPRIGSPLTARFPVTQLFAENPAFYSKLKYIGHNGLDFGTPIGSQIIAVDAGTVSQARVDPPGYGNYIRVDHAWGISLYAHLSEIQVSQGQAVGRGQRIGLSGNSGLSSGPHLHFEIRVYPVKDSNGYGGRVDPLPMIDRQHCTYLGYVPEALKKGL